MLFPLLPEVERTINQMFDGSERVRILDMFRSYTMTDQAAILAVLPGPGETIDFDGQNCDDVAYDGDGPCYGWDGYSRRCSCGNRRVSWVVEGGYARAEAY